MKKKKPLTKQAFLNSYKSKPLSVERGARQVFGLSTETQYTRNQFQPKRVEWLRNFNIYASSCDKTLHLFDAMGNPKNSIMFAEALRTQGLSCLTYISKYHIFLCFSFDFKVYMLSDLLQVWHEIQLNPGRVQQAVFLEESDRLIVCGINEICIYKFTVISRYDIVKTLLLDPEPGILEFKLELIKTVHADMRWMKGSRMDFKYRYMSVWSESAFNLFSMDDFALLQEGRDLCPGTLITECLYAVEQEYCICGTTEGQIMIYKIGKHSRQVHTFVGHIRGIASLTGHSNPTYFLSAGLDCAVKMWSLGSFEWLYTFKIPHGDSIGYMSFLNNYQLAYYTNGVFYVSRINFLGDCFAISKSKVKKVLWIKDKIGVLGEDNSVVLYFKNGKVSSTIYPPPTANDVKDVFYIEEIDRVVLLLHSGSLCVFKCQGETGLLVKIVYTGDIKDVRGRTIGFPIRCFKPIETVPPFFDCEETIQRKNKNEHGFYDQFPVEFPNKFVAVSLGKGTLVFLQIEHLTTVFSRYIIHRETIISIEELPGFLVTLCLGNIFIISRFNSQELVGVHRIDIKRPLNLLAPLPPDRLLLGLQNGDTEIFRITEDQISRSCAKLAGVDSPLLSAIVKPPYIVAACPDSKIKTIDFGKFLRQEITLPEMPVDMIYFDEGLLVAHGSSLSLLSFLGEELSGGEEEEEVVPEYYFREFESLPKKSVHVELAEFRSEAAEDISEELWSKAMKEYDAQQDKEVKALLGHLDKVKSRRQKGTGSLKKRSKKKKKEEKPPSPRTIEIQDNYKKIMSEPLPSFQPTNQNKQPALLTRRQLTEERIIANIQKYGDPAERVDPRGLCVIDEALYFQELSRVKARDQSPKR